ncbi:MAG: hypothetical protein ACK5MA_04475 [Parachlamydiaceae bacterium]
MTTVKEVCKKYFDLIHTPREGRDRKHQALAAAAILSCFTVIIPAVFGAVYGIAKLVNKVKKGEAHPRIDEVTSPVFRRSSEVPPRRNSSVIIPTPSSSSSPVIPPSSSSSSSAKSASASAEPVPVPEISLEEKKVELEQALNSRVGMGTLLKEENREALVALAKERYSQIGLKSLLEASQVMENPTENPLLIDLMALRIMIDLRSWGYMGSLDQLAPFLFVLPEQAQAELLKNRHFLENLTEQMKEAIVAMPSESFVPKAALKGILDQGLFGFGELRTKWIENLPESVWEAAIAEFDKDSLYIESSYRVQLLTENYPDKQLCILRGMLKNPHTTIESDSILTTIQSQFSLNDPAKLLREIGADNLRKFPWHTRPNSLGEAYEQFINIILPRLDMSRKKDVAILNALAQSPLFDQGSWNLKDSFSNLLTPEMRKKLILNEVHPSLQLYLRLPEMPVEEIYKVLITGNRAILEAYVGLDYPRFPALFAHACSLNPEDLPAVILDRVESVFRTPDMLVDLETADQILRAGRLLTKQQLEGQFLKRFLMTFANQSIEKIRAMEQLLAEKQVIVSDDTFNFYECCREETYYTSVPLLAQNLDDPFLLLPLLLSNGKSIPTHGPLAGDWAVQIWNNRDFKNFSFYTDLMVALENAPWKFALMLEDRSAFNTVAFNNWFNAPETSKPADLNVPHLSEWREWLRSTEGQEKWKFHNSLISAVSNKTYDDFKKVLEQSSKAKEIFTAAIMGPAPETVAQRIQDYSERQLLPALLTAEGKARLKPHLKQILNNEKLSVEFRNWVRNNTQT